jgi:hypothetical protein
MATLFLIGNGFDLWHGLPTSYDHFYEFARDTLKEIENYYLLDFSHANPWHDFENDLGTFSWSKFYDAHNELDPDDEGFRPSFAFGLEDSLVEQADLHVNAIRDCFQEWVTSIDISTTERKLDFLQDPTFITFNYTSTLETTYGIEDYKVLHIHGRAETYDELIFGHGETMEEKLELDEHGDSNRTMFSDAESSAKYPFYALQKPVSELLDKLQKFLNPREPFQEIIVIGHSLNKIDLPYFKILNEQSPDAIWKICLYNRNEQEHHIKALVNCGVSCKKIHTFGYQDLAKSAD